MNANSFFLLAEEVYFERERNIKFKIWLKRQFGWKNQCQWRVNRRDWAVSKTQSQLSLLRVKFRMSSTDCPGYFADHWENIE